MTTPSRREALLGRFRHGSLARIDGMLVRIEEHEETEGLATGLWPPLHTLKGEARMLGLASLAAFVHTIEDTLGEVPVEPDARQEQRRKIAAALRFVRDWLETPLADDEDAARRLERGRTLVCDTAPSDEPAPESEPESEPEPELSPDDTQLTLVQTETIDALCERLEQLRVAYERQRRAPTRSDDDRFVQELSELSELAWSLRLVPVEPALDGLSAHARKLARERGKQAQVVVDAGGAQLERSLLEHLHEPLLHLVNNAIDHGVEAPNERGSKPATATLTIIARSLGRSVEIELSDDGRGVDLEQVRRRASERGRLDIAETERATADRLHELLFEPGFTTAREVDELSGRGVGLAVVRRSVEAIGGEVAIDSQHGHGTRFYLRVPATISREPVLVVELDGARWGLPSRRVGPVVRLDGSSLRPTLVVDGEHVVLLSLARLLGVGDRQVPRVAVFCAHAGRRYALACPGLLGEHELFRRPLGPTLARTCPASSSAIMDDGGLVLLLEPAALLDRRLRSRARMEPGPAPAPDNPAEPGGSATPRSTVLVVDDSAIVRELLGELLRGAGFRVASAGDGHEALSRLRRADVDIVLADIEMPNMDGFALLTRVRERDPELPVVMLTTRASDADRRQAAALGASAYLVKSEFREQSLLDTITRFVEVPT